MAGLFKRTLLLEKIADTHIPDMQAKIQLLQNRYDAQISGSLIKKTETECEQAFNDDVFKQVLGYTSYPSNPYTIDPKGRTQTSGQKPDAILGHYNPDEKDSHKHTQVVVEIKDAKTPLDKSQKREGNLSPIQQGFKYKPQYQNCKRVIATNFIEIRLYKDTLIDFEIRTLADLVDPSNDYENFRNFWWLLCADHLISKTGPSITEALLSEVRIEQEFITKKFYKEYKQLRMELIQDLIKNNPDKDYNMLITKAQKIIDRLIFVHFCEDLGLLPEEKLAEVVAYGDNMIGMSTRTILASFFEAVNSGSDKLGIPDGYNGGLFHKDDILDHLKVGDDICKKFVEMGAYDFADDLSVNILGHIFEQSISDLEDLRAHFSSEPDTGTSKRKKDGVFYTPEYIVEYIVKNSLGVWLDEKFEAIKKKVGLKEDITDKNYAKREIEAYGLYQLVLQEVKVLDPACGSGAFLVNVFDYLLEENVRVMKILAGGDTGLFDMYSIAKNILTNNIYGVDLNEESVEITKLSLWLKTAQKGKKLADLDGNIKCGNSLIDDPAVAGDKAFDWHQQYKNIMGSGGFDVVVGNPPYGAKLQKKDYNFLINKYIKGGGETAISFIKLSYDFLKPNGNLGFIIPKSFIFSSNYESIRNFVMDDFQYLVDCGKVWKEVKIEEVMIGIKKGISSDIYTSSKLDDGIVAYISSINKSLVNKFGFIINGVNSSEIDLGEKMTNDGLYLNDYSSNSRGGIFQKHILEQGDKNVLGGSEIQRHGVIGTKGKISLDVIKGDKKAIVQNDSILVQRIIAHITKPTNKIKITACIPKKTDFVIVDTINQITPIDSSYRLNIRAILNSKLINRFVYRFIFGLAIRTMQFDNPVTSRLPVSLDILEDIELNKLSKSLQLSYDNFHNELNKTLKFLKSRYSLEKIPKKLQNFTELDFENFKKALKLKKLSLSDEEELMIWFHQKHTTLSDLQSQIDTLDTQIDEMVFDLYDLTQEEREIVLSS